MVFKKIAVFTWNPTDFDVEKLEETLSSRRFRGCLPLQPKSAGWVPSGIKDEDLLVYPLSGRYLLTMRVETKNVSKADLDAAYEKRLVELDSLSLSGDEGTEDGDKADDAFSVDELKSIKEGVYHDLLKRAVPKQVETHAYLDKANKLLVVEANYKKAAGFVRDLVVGLDDEWAKSILPISTEEAPTDAMTSWVLGDSRPDDMLLGTACEISFPGEKGKIKYSNESLNDDHLVNYLAEGRKVDLLEMMYRDGCSFQLASNWEIKGIKATNFIEAETVDTEIDDENELFCVEFLAGADFIANTISLLVEACGGLYVEEKEAAGEESELAA